MNIGIIFLHCIMSLVQIYIFLLIGIWAYYKKLIKKERSVFISRIIAYYCFPIYNIVEIAKVSTIANMKIFWMLMVSTIASLWTGMLISFLFSKLFKLDKRTLYSFTLTTSLSAIGLLPLVLGKALCIDEGPLGGDPRCSVITGYMVINLMIFNIQLNFTGYSIIFKDIDLVLPFNEKLHYLWHLFLYKMGKNDIVVLDLFEKFIADFDQAYIKYLEFIKYNKIIHYKGLEFVFFSKAKTNDSGVDNVIVLQRDEENTDANNVEIHDHNLDYSIIDTRKNKIIKEVNPEHRICEEDHYIPTSDLIKISVEKYYNLIFNIIESDLNVKKKVHYEEEKHIIKHNLSHFPPKFPTVKSLDVNKNTINEIENEFTHFQETVRQIEPEFNIAKYTKKSILVILGRVYYPSIIASFMGMIIGLSGMSNILYSTNHYLSNFFEGLSIISVLNVPFIYVAAGYIMASSSKVTRDMVLTKKHILISLIVRFIIIPGIGMLWIYLWVTYYGGIVKESKVIRFSMFIPFCLPVAANTQVFLNLVNYYTKESAYQIFIQYVLSLILLAGLFLVYFVTLGS
jgi:predicted permease